MASFVVLTLYSGMRAMGAGVELNLYRFTAFDHICAEAPKLCR